MYAVRALLSLSSCVILSYLPYSTTKKKHTSMKKVFHAELHQKQRSSANASNSTNDNNKSNTNDADNDGSQQKYQAQSNIRVSTSR